MKILVKLAATLVATVVAFCLGFVLTSAAYELFYVPFLVKRYPHDGQIGLAVFTTAFSGACICAVGVLLIGVVWTVRTTRESQALSQRLNPN